MQYLDIVAKICNYAFQLKFFNHVIQIAYKYKSSEIGHWHDVDAVLLQKQ